MGAFYSSYSPYPPPAVSADSPSASHWPSPYACRIFPNHSVDGKIIPALFDGPNPVLPLVPNLPTPPVDLVTGLLKRYYARFVPGFNAGTSAAILSASTAKTAAQVEITLGAKFAAEIDHIAKGATSEVASKEFRDALKESMLATIAACKDSSLEVRAEETRALALQAEIVAGRAFREYVESTPPFPCGLNEINTEAARLTLPLAPCDIVKKVCKEIVLEKGRILEPEILPDISEASSWWTRIQKGLIE